MNKRIKFLGSPNIKKKKAPDAKISATYFIPSNVTNIGIAAINTNEIAIYKYESRKFTYQLLYYFSLNFLLKLWKNVL